MTGKEEKKLKKCEREMIRRVYDLIRDGNDYKCRYRENITRGKFSKSR